MGTTKRLMARGAPKASIFSMIRGSTVSELAVEKPRISSALRMRISLNTEKPQIRATSPNTTTPKNAMAAYTRVTRRASGHSEAKPKLATVTEISAKTPSGA